MPIKFSLDGDQGLAVILDGYPTATPISCTTGAVTGSPEEINVSEALSYRSDIDTYSLTWKTAKGSNGLPAAHGRPGRRHGARGAVPLHQVA